MPATLTRPPVPVNAPAASPAAAQPAWSAMASADLLAFRAGVVRFSWTDVQKMWQAGILHEDSSTELLDGILVYRDCRSGEATGLNGVEHEWTVGRLGDLGRHVDGPACHIRTRATLRMSETYNPVPDMMILRGEPGEYRRRQPTPADVLCLIEVADSSYARDPGEKRAAYAAAGVGQCVLIDLRRRVAEVCADPEPAAGTYPSPLIVPSDGSIALRVGDGQTFAVPLGELLP